jgi:hypothetical protein
MCGGFEVLRRPIARPVCFEILRSGALSLNTKNGRIGQVAPIQIKKPGIRHRGSWGRRLPADTPFRATLRSFTTIVEARACGWLPCFQTGHPLRSLSGPGAFGDRLTHLDDFRLAGGPSFLTPGRSISFSSSFRRYAALSASDPS